MKIFLIYIHSLQNVLESLVTVQFFKNNVALGDFSIKKKEHPPVRAGVFVNSGWLVGLYNSQVTNSSARGRFLECPLRVLLVA